MSERPVKVVLVCEAAGGGVGKHVLDVAERLPPLGFDVLLAHSTNRAEPQFVERLSHHARFGYRLANVDVGRAPHPRDVVGTLQLRRAIRAFGGADVLHGHSAKGGALARLAQWRRARRVFYTPHAFYAQAPSLPASARLFYGLVERGLAFATDRVIATSREELALARALGIPARKLTIVENGIDLRSDDEIARARAAIRASLGVAADEVVVGFLGRLVPQKAPDVAVETFRLLRTEYPKLRFVLAGDGPLAPQVAQALDSAGLTSHVHWDRAATGHGMLPAVDVLLVTSHYEGFPYVMLEALAAGCAIVTTDVGGARDCVLPGRNGEIAVASAGALAVAARPFIDRPDVLRAARVVSRARAHQFTLGRMLDRLAVLYRSDARDAP